MHINMDRRVPPAVRPYHNYAQTFTCCALVRGSVVDAPLSVLRCCCCIMHTPCMHTYCRTSVNH